MYSKNFIITYDEGRLFVLNLDKLRVEAITQIMRGISDVAICGKEIFVLEGPRSLIRLSSAPEPPNKTSKYYNITVLIVRCIYLFLCYVLSK